MSLNQSMDFTTSYRRDMTENPHRSFILNGTLDATSNDGIFGRLNAQNGTILDSSVYAKLDPSTVKQKTDRLHEFFLEISQGRTNEAEMFDAIHNMIQACNEVFDDILRNGGLTSDQQLFEWLDEERNTWKLLYCMYKDRLLNQQSMDDANDDEFFLDASEKEIIEKLYKDNEVLREYQLIVDWLEQCETQRRFGRFAQFMDETVSWENTFGVTSNAGDAILSNVQQSMNKALFPSEKGFLVDPDTINPFLDEDRAPLGNRSEQLNGIRKLCIPQLVLLLHNILHSSGNYKGAIQIIDDLVSENCQLYTVYSKHQLTEIIGKMAESSLAALNSKMDPWGYVSPQ